MKTVKFFFFSLFLLFFFLAIRFFPLLFQYCASFYTSSLDFATYTLACQLIHVRVCIVCVVVYVSRTVHMCEGECVDWCAICFRAPLYSAICMSRYTDDNLFGKIHRFALLALIVSHEILIINACTPPIWNEWERERKKNRKAFENLFFYVIRRVGFMGFASIYVIENARTHIPQLMLTSHSILYNAHTHTHTRI